MQSVFNKKWGGQIFIQKINVLSQSEKMPYWIMDPLDIVDVQGENQPLVVNGS